VSPQLEPPEKSPAGRSRRATATRVRLFVAGRQAFARKGLAGTNLKLDILGPAGVSVGSFYHQFKDKTELLLGILDEYSEDFRCRLHEVHRPHPGRSLDQITREAYKLVFSIAAENADIWRIQLRERDSEDERIRAYLQRDRTRWHESLSADFRRISEASGAPIPDDGAAELMLALSLGAIARYLEEPSESRDAVRQRLLDNLVRFTLAGLPGLLVDDGGPTTATP
jgi:AcrR family transcriptional regulator